MIKVTAKNISHIKELLADLQKKQLAFVLEGGQVIGTEMKVRINNVSGRTAGSIKTNSYVIEGGAESETGPDTESKIPLYLEYGTGVHAKPEGGGTRAKKIPWTYFSEELNRFFTTHGMEARPFAEPGFQAAKPAIDRMAETDLRA
jgi:hypothetical protein